MRAVPHLEPNADLLVAIGRRAVDGHTAGSPVDV